MMEQDSLVIFEILESWVLLPTIQFTAEAQRAQREIDFL